MNNNMQTFEDENDQLQIRKKKTTNATYTTLASGSTLG